MAEILGVAASASQLGSTCFSLIDVMKKIKGGESTLQRYNEQLQELQSISTCISQNPLLQTPEIGSQTDALLYIINNNCLNTLLRKGRVLRTWGFLYREQELLDIFVRLERQKSNLSLAIEQIQSQALFQIQTDIQAMSETKRSISSTSSFASSTESGTLVGAGYFGSPSSFPDIHEFNLYSQALMYPKMFSNAFQNHSSSSFSQKSAGSPDEPPASQPTQPNDDSSTYGSGIWYNNSFAGHGHDQINGPVYQGDVHLLQGLANNNAGRKNSNRYIYTNSTKAGDGNQHNGRLFEFEGDTKGATEPDMNGDEWHNCRAMPWQSANPGPARHGTQTNGPIFRRKQRQEGEKKKE
ncbi:hypothetical protein F53441_5483 [Fusarium austroafricanum]|uniref:Fungal N-terminal domain-containing protein n=1 Tax=Fusarium austroafricanum TaxID=2364996 RepID=A0A8H4KI48_9HYPO|nr:hypothetical protein F53441_5483 [Fusarium austroafricanum]